MSYNFCRIHPEEVRDPHPPPPFRGEGGDCSSLGAECDRFIDQEEVRGTRNELIGRISCNLVELPEAWGDCGRLGAFGILRRCAGKNLAVRNDFFTSSIVIHGSGAGLGRWM